MLQHVQKFEEDIAFSLEEQVVQDTHLQLSKERGDHLGEVTAEDRLNVLTCEVRVEHTEKLVEIAEIVLLKEGHFCFGFLCHYTDGDLGLRRGINKCFLVITTGFIFIYVYLTIVVIIIFLVVIGIFERVARATFLLSTLHRFHVLLKVVLIIVFKCSLNIFDIFYESLLGCPFSTFGQCLLHGLGL